jgi:hypothetical protein
MAGLFPARRIPDRLALRIRGFQPVFRVGVYSICQISTQRAGLTRSVSDYDRINQISRAKLTQKEISFPGNMVNLHLSSVCSVLEAGQVLAWLGARLPCPTTTTGRMPLPLADTRPTRF